MLYRVLSNLAGHDPKRVISKGETIELDPASPAARNFLAVGAIEPLRDLPPQPPSNLQLSQENESLKARISELQADLIKARAAQTVPPDVSKWQWEYLQNECKDRGIEASGNRDALIARLTTPA